jgi:hypothetical protein
LSFSRHPLAPIAVACWLGLAALVPGTTRAADPGPLEYAVKATYLYKFAPFVEWPPGAFETPVAPLNLCVVRFDPFGPVLDRAVEGQRIGDRPIIVRRLAAPDRGVPCHVIYVGSTPGGAAAEILAQVRGWPVLTVTDGERDLRAKGVVNFIIDNNRVRFEIDNAAAGENGLAISSKLLGLAAAVRTRTP